MTEVLQQIATQQNLQLNEVKPLQGGDINDVFLLKCAEGVFVLKLNSASKFPDMFVVEATGLKLLVNSGSFRIPEVIAQGQYKDYAYLLLEYIRPGIQDNDIWSDFAQNLAHLHQNTSERFGLDHSNYIGSLPQQNNYSNTASDFYIAARLDPQFKLALEKGFDLKVSDRFFRNISEEIPSEAPSLVHGDLWNGNYLISEKSEAVLIDPAVAYAPREMDIGMMHLFGGFPSGLFEEYHTIFPLEPHWRDRLPVWQLYYLLVHLNLFGSGYLSQVTSIVRRYS
ncbi:fructosamine kinase family protein [Constantimarinum furrinae]|uniref:Fructosamine kinase n=1 Tax=Constantimarinum furrinae TaxID=2562285 RepID=A0A7G8PU79_9FLAO|nr:fructosamine kinase family protein [Constantimarinum furrinae]QNJ97895.1 fructosamine kinase [Constantimarinum furrinae]